MVTPLLDTPPRLLYGVEKDFTELILHKERLLWLSLFCRILLGNLFDELTNFEIVKCFHEADKLNNFNLFFFVS
jgi:hypothetical protein